MQTSRDSPLRLFCPRWIAFCRGSENNDVSKVMQRNEYGELNISIQGSSDDPRTWQILHLYEPCGKSMTPECLHGTNTPQTSWPQMRQPWTCWPRLDRTRRRRDRLHKTPSFRARSHRLVWLYVACFLVCSSSLSLCRAIIDEI